MLAHLIHSVTQDKGIEIHLQSVKDDFPMHNYQGHATIITIMITHILCM
jgi:hypothetical protein